MNHQQELQLNGDPNDLKASINLHNAIGNISIHETRNVQHQSDNSKAIRNSSRSINIHSKKIINYQRKETSTRSDTHMHKATSDIVPVIGIVDSDIKNHNNSKDLELDNIPSSERGVNNNVETAYRDPNENILVVEETDDVTFTRDEVAEHSDFSSCWIIIKDKVYDVTKFMKEHPGGEEIILEHAGWNATNAFNSVGHTRDAKDILEQYYIGLLKD